VLAEEPWEPNIGGGSRTILVNLTVPIAAPIIGGMVTSTIHVLIITPVIFYLMKVRALRKGSLKVSGMAL